MLALSKSALLQTVNLNHRIIFASHYLVRDRQSKPWNNIYFLQKGNIIRRIIFARYYLVIDRNQTWISAFYSLVTDRQYNMKFRVPFTWSIRILISVLSYSLFLKLLSNIIELFGSMLHSMKMKYTDGLRNNIKANKEMLEPEGSSPRETCEKRIC